MLPSTALVLASGNNLTCVGDVSRRTVLCRLDAEVERPDTRAFDFDCHQEVLDQRPHLVIAGLTILRAFIHAGQPVTLTPLGSFDDWAWVRGALVWLGCADPADGRQSSVERDPRQAELFAVTQLWARAFGSRGMDVALGAGADCQELFDIRNEVRRADQSSAGRMNEDLRGEPDVNIRSEQDRGADEGTARC